jgi:hypothetical protein
MTVPDRVLNRTTLLRQGEGILRLSPLVKVSKEDHSALEEEGGRLVRRRARRAPPHDRLGGRAGTRSSAPNAFAPNAFSFP